MASTAEVPLKRRKKHLSWWIVLLVLLVGGGAAYAYLNRPWEPKPKTVQVEIVKPAPFTQVLALNGRVAATQTVDVRSSVSGQALDVRVAEGDAVTKGQMLLQLDDTEARAMLDQAQAALDAGLVKQTQAQATADRAAALGDNAARSTREDAQLALTAAQTEVARLQAALQQARSQLDNYTIKAPISGTVLSRGVEDGQLVDPQTTLLTVANLDQLMVETDVDELYSSRIAEGLKALLKPVGDSVPHDGKVSFASPSVDPATGGRAIKIAFDEPVDLPVGLTVNANIIVSETPDAIAVPRSAIVTEGTASHVLVVVDGLAEQRDVNFSDWPAERVIVTDGLSAGDKVIVDPNAARLGQAVTAE